MTNKQLFDNIFKDSNGHKIAVRANTAMFGKKVECQIGNFDELEPMITPIINLYFGPIEKSDSLANTNSSIWSCNSPMELWKEAPTLKRKCEDNYGSPKKTKIDY